MQYAQSKIKEKLLLTVFFITFGCKVNCYETECIKKMFLENGFKVSENSSDADAVIINSCTVTSASDKKVRQTLRKIRNENPSALTVLTGCYPQAFRKEAESLTEADIVTGTKDRSALLNLVLEGIENRKRIVKVEPYDLSLIHI